MTKPLSLFLSLAFDRIERIRRDWYKPKWAGYTSTKGASALIFHALLEIDLSAYSVSSKRCSEKDSIFVTSPYKNHALTPSYRNILADFRIFDIEIFLPLQVFYPSDSARRDEQKTLYNLPSKGPLEFSRNF